MTLTINDDDITSDHTPHTARLASGGSEHLGGVLAPRPPPGPEQAITAIVLADLTGPGGIHAGHRHWPNIEGWAAELALTAPEALTQIANSPGWKDAAPDDPEAAG